MKYNRRLSLIVGSNLEDTQQRENSTAQPNFLANICTQISLLMALLVGVTSAKQPNIVFLMTDDQRCDTIGCYGRPEFKTETIDHLASQGVVFDNAYHAVAICKPSRATVMTGRYLASHQCGFVYPFDRVIPAKEFGDSYHAILKKAGYRSGFIGKFGFTVEGNHNTLRQSFDYYDAGGRWAEDMSRFEKIYYEGRPKNERTIMKGDSMVNFLETQPKGQPFVLSISFDAVKNDKNDDIYPADHAAFQETEFSVPKNWSEGANEKLPLVVKKNARGIPLHKHYCDTPEKYQTLVKRFAAQGLTVDRQVKRLLAQLTEMGELDNTIIIYTSDNGRFHGSHGIFDKALLYEESVKAPLIIWDGRTAEKDKGRRENALISTTDFAPTILALTGQPIPESIQGVSLTPLLDGTADRKAWRQSVFLENLFIQEVFAELVKASRTGIKPDLPKINSDIIAGNRSYRSRGVRTHRYKYFAYFEHDPVIEELYDLETDPDEMHNLSESADHQEILQQLRAQTESYTAEFSLATQ